MAYDEESFLQLSGLQHFIFCKRQWALIHLEQLWKENEKTMDGRIMHRNAHDADQRTRRGDVLTIRAMKIRSVELGLSGECDVVEFHRDDGDGIPLIGETGRWLPFPVEYKRGRVKAGPEDEAQLCAQAMCLEEMLCCHIPEGALFYGATRHRHEVVFSDVLRDLVKKTSAEMHQYYEKGYTPKPHQRKACESCSLMGQCLPSLTEHQSVRVYMERYLHEDNE